MIEVSPKIRIPEKEIRFQYTRSSGPGGQHVNKVSTAVQLMFDVKNTKTLPEDIKRRLFRIEKGRITKEGVLLIDSRGERYREVNKKNAVERLVELIRMASRKPKTRKKTRLPYSARQKRLARKRRRSITKRLRKISPSDE